MTAILALIGCVALIAAGIAAFLKWDERNNP